MIKSIGATQSDGVITIPKSYTTQDLGAPGDNWDVAGSPKPRTELKSAGRLAKEQADAARLFGELKAIEADLKKLQNQAERQTKIKIPGLGSGARQ